MSSVLILDEKRCLLNGSNIQTQLNSYNGLVAKITEEIATAIASCDPLHTAKVTSEIKNKYKSELNSYERDEIFLIFRDKKEKIYYDWFDVRNSAPLMNCLEQNNVKHKFTQHGFSERFWTVDIEWS